MTFTRVRSWLDPRLEDNVGFDTLEVMRMLAPEAWRYIGRLVIAVEGVELSNDFTAVVATANGISRLGSRCLPERVRSVNE